MNIKKLKIMLLLFLSFMQVAWTQNVYIDPTTTAALATYAKSLKSGQDKTIKEQKKLQTSQNWVAAQMLVANNIQDNLLKGLREVSGTLQNGIQLQQIYSNLKDCTKYSSEISHLVTKHPEFAVFGSKATKLTYDQVLKIGVEVTDILSEGDLNLATAGDRYRMLFELNQNITSLKLWLITIKMDIERAIRLGFLRSLNPFQHYVNTDRAIIKEITDKYKYNF